MITIIIVIGVLAVFGACWALARAADDEDDYLDLFKDDRSE